MTHTQKVRLARKMITLAEIKDGVTIFSSRAWLLRKRARDLKVRKQYWAGFVRTPSPTKAEVVTPGWFAKDINKIKNWIKTWLS